jgi:hypothetical protein
VSFNGFVSFNGIVSFIGSWCLLGLMLLACPRRRIHREERERGQSGEARQRT